MAQADKYDIIKAELSLLLKGDIDELEEETFGILLIIPLILLLLSLYLFPVYRGIWYSFHEISIFATDPKFAGLANYARLFSSDRFFNALTNGVVYTVGSVALTLVFGVGSALLLNRSFVGERLATGLVLSPYMMPIVGVVIIFRWFFNGLTGVANYALIVAGLIEEQIAWFSDPQYAMPVLMLISGWRLYPFVTMLVLAKLQTIPDDYYEAAELMGASKWRQFRSITLPQLRGVLFIAILLRMIWTFNLFDIIWLGTQGGPGTATETLPVMAYRVTFDGLHLGRGAAIAVMTFLVLLIGTITYFKLYGQEET